LNIKKGREQMTNNSTEITKILIEKKLLTEGMSINAKIPTLGFGGAPIFVTKYGKISKVNDDSISVYYEDRKIRDTKFEDIIDIEGMDIQRYAQAYRIKVKPKKTK
jgi:hypothetical protein